MAADLAFLTRLPGPQHHAVPPVNARYRSRTEEARGSNPLTSTPSTAGQSVASFGRVALAACWGRVGAADAYGRVLDVGWGAAAELVDRQSNRSLDWV